ncbi:piggyBac transposable element-derived protein 4-like [Diretmus argenteus]
MPKAPCKRGGPRPGAGQLTLAQALNRVKKERNLVETDSDEPPEDVCSSSSEHHDSEEWLPFRASPRSSKRKLPDSSSDSEDEGEWTAGARPMRTRRARESRDDESVHSSSGEEGAGPSSTRQARVDSEEEEQQQPPPPASTGRKRAGKSQRDPPSWRSMADWSPRAMSFTAVPGPLKAAASLESDEPVHFFELLLSDEVLQLIVVQSNLYAEQCIALLDQLATPYSRLNAWKPLTVGELKRFLGLLFLTGLIRKPSLAEYWSLNTALETPYFRATMPRNRFQLIWRFLHFSDNREVDAADRLHKVRPVLDLLLANFRGMFQPSQNISLDEGMMAWRGRLRFRVYNPAKPTKYGIKSYILCDSDNGYCYSMKPYCGEHSSLQDTVRFLIDGLDGFGYRLWMDNYYNSEAMCRLLLSLDIHSAGTLRVNRGEPPSIREVRNTQLAVGERLARHNDVAMVLAWRDKRIVRMISTFHKDEMKTVAVRQRGQSDRITQLKPACVVDYNHFMNGVDRLDQKVAYYPFMRKTAKWTSKFVMYLIQIAISNSFILYKARNPTSNRKMKDFILSSIVAWTQTPAHPPPEQPSPPPPPPAAMATPAHLRRRVSATRLEVDFAGHVLVELQPTATHEKPFRRCQVHLKKGKRRETKYVCPRCDYVPMCIYPCYFEYHSQ